MDHYVRLAHQRAHQFAVANIAVPKLIAIGTHRAVRGVLNVTGIGQGIDYEQLVVGIFLVEMPHQVTADEARTACYQNRLHYLVFVLPSEIIFALSSPQLKSRSSADRKGTKAPCCCG